MLLLILTNSNKHIMKNKALIILLAIAGSIGNTMAQTPAVMLNDKSGWHKIAGKNVDLERDRDEIPVVGADRFASVKIVVTAGALNLYDMEVYYDDGSKQVIEVRKPVSAGVDSRAFDLKSNEKDMGLAYRTHFYGGLPKRADHDRAQRKRHVLH